MSDPTLLDVLRTISFARNEPRYIMFKKWYLLGLRQSGLEACCKAHLPHQIRNELDSVMDPDKLTRIKLS